MIYKKDSVWIDLYNSLYIVSSSSSELIKLETPIFEPLDELETALINGFHVKSLKLFVDEKWITLLQKKELLKFKTYIEKIDSAYWNLTDFDNHPDWILVRKWANSILQNLEETKRGWDSTNEIVIES